MTGTNGTRTGQLGLLSQRQGEEDWDRTGQTPLGVSQLSQQRCATFYIGSKAVGNFFEGKLT